MAQPRQVTLPALLGEDLTMWVIDEHNAARLTLPKLRAKLDENAPQLLERGVIAGYAYYAVEHVFQRMGTPIPEK